MRVAVGSGKQGNERDRESRIFTRDYRVFLEIKSKNKKIKNNNNNQLGFQERSELDEASVT